MTMTTEQAKTIVKHARKAPSRDFVTLRVILTREELREVARVADSRSRIGYGESIDRSAWTKIQKASRMHLP